MQKEEMKTVAELIAAKITVDKIYCHYYGDDKIQQYHLLILLPNTVGNKFTELQPFVKMAISERPDITFGLHHTSTIKNALNNGNLYFHIVCIDSNLLYNRPGSPVLPIPNAEDLLQWKEDAIVRFRDGVGKTTAFLEGADFYRDKNETGLTVFMLHQVAELTYRALEISILTKEKQSHNITLHQSFITPYIPHIGILFPADTAEEKALLKTLNDAYSSVRYEQNHTVDEKYVPILYERITLLHERSKVIIEELNQVLEDKHQEALLSQGTAAREPEKPTVPTGDAEQDKFFNHSALRRDLKEISDLIVEHLAPDLIYVFGNLQNQSERVNLFDPHNNGTAKEQHYDLLAICSRTNPYGDNILSMVNKPEDQMTINLLIHSHEEVLKKLTSRNRFFETVIRFGKVIHSRITPIDKTGIPPIDISQTYIQTKSYATSRINRANALLIAAEGVNDKALEVKVSLLAQSMEQACLGLIYTYLGYYPNLHSLPHLLKLCNIFWPEDKVFFPVLTADDQLLLNTLSRSYSECRFNVGQPVAPEILDRIYLSCVRFVETSEMLCLKEIENLGTQAITSASLINQTPVI